MGAMEEAAVVGRGGTLVLSWNATHPYIWGQENVMNIQCGQGRCIKSFPGEIVEDDTFNGRNHLKHLPRSDTYKWGMS